MGGYRRNHVDITLHRAFAVVARRKSGQSFELKVCTVATTPFMFPPPGESPADVLVLEGFYRRVPGRGFMNFAPRSTMAKVDALLSQVDWKVLDGKRTELGGEREQLEDRCACRQ